MKNFPTFVPVVAVAMIDPQRGVLMQRRRRGSRHGGLWEFPGGKVEPGESLESAIIREIDEELGVTLAGEALVPAAFSADPEPRSESGDPHVILLYTCRQWHGEPLCVAGEAIGWFSADGAARLDVPPLDRPLVSLLPRWLATDAA